MRNKKVPGPGIGKPQNQVFLFQLIQCDHAFLGQRVFVGYGENQGIRIQHDGIEIGIRNTALHNCQINLIGFQLHIKIIYRVRNNCYPCFLAHTAVSGQDLHHDIAFGGMGNTYRDLSCVLFFFLQALFQVLIEAVNPFGILDDDLPLPGKLEIPLSPGKNGDPKLLLQLSDMLAHRGLGKGQFPGGLGKAVQFVHRQQGDKLGINHGFSPYKYL